MEEALKTWIHHFLVGLVIVSKSLQLGSDGTISLSRSKRPWTDALNVCIDKNQQLPNADSLLEFKKVTEILEQQGLKTAWLGIKKEAWDNRLDTEFKWLDGTYFVEKLSGDDYTGPKKECGILETDYGRKDDALCADKSHGYICEVPDSTSLFNLSPYEKIEWGGKNYLIYDSVSSWFMARYLCLEKGGQLALLKSDRDRENVASRIKKFHKNKKYFIGFRSVDVFYTDKDGGKRAIIHHHWYPGEPSAAGDCIVLQKYAEGYFWKSEGCNKKHSVLCHTKKKKVPTATLR